MDLQEFTKSLCQKYHLKPQRKRGQNFLIDEKVLKKIIETASIRKDDIVLEVGPGFGTLTRELAKRVKKVLAVEIDLRLAKALKEILRDYKNVEIVREDVLNLQPTTYNLQPLTYKIVANLPYNITSRFLRKFLASAPRPKEMILLLQKEVAERIVAPRGQKSLLSISVQVYGKPQIIAKVPKTCFWPSPEVDSAILKISRIKNKFWSRISTNNNHELRTNKSVSQGRADEEWFWKVVKRGFQARRKQLKNNLKGLLRDEKGYEKILRVLESIGLGPKVRAQDLSVEDWVKLARKLLVAN